MEAAAIFNTLSRTYTVIQKKWETEFRKYTRCGY